MRVMKRTHKNWWSANINSKWTVYFNTPDGRASFWTPLWLLEEQELIDFGFEKEKDKYEECADEIRNQVRIDMWLWGSGCGYWMENILKKHFPQS